MKLPKLGLEEGTVLILRVKLFAGSRRFEFDL